VGDFGAADAYWPPGVDDDQRACTSVVNGGDDRYLAQSADLGRKTAGIQSRSA
jgi:hypothetical protein